MADLEKVLSQSTVMMDTHTDSIFDGSEIPEDGSGFMGVGHNPDPTPEVIGPNQVTR